MRSARTREQVLDATIACLAEFGYAGLTTRRVAAAAGLTRGAQQHHFAGKAAMVSEAVVHLARRVSDEMVADLASAPAEERTTEAILDALWRMHRSQLFAVGLELWVAARTDAELRAALEDVERSLTANVAETVYPLFGTVAAAPGFAHRLEDVLAAMRGVAILGLADPAGPRIDRRWSRMRPWLAGRLANRE